MNTYLVRTKSDHILVGIFCAENLSDLATLIDSVFDATECEYLPMRANEGLFVEAKFVTKAPVAPGKPERVILTHVDDVQEMEDRISERAQDAEDAANLILLSAEDEYIPPVLEPTFELSQRIQSAHEISDWRPVVARQAGGTKSAAQRPPACALTSSPAINSDSIACKLMAGGLNASTFIRNASTRHH